MGMETGRLGLCCLSILLLRLVPTACQAAGEYLRCFLTAHPCLVLRFSAALFHDPVASCDISIGPARQRQQRSPGIPPLPPAGRIPLTGSWLDEWPGPPPAPEYSPANRAARVRRTRQSDTRPAGSPRSDAARWESAPTARLSASTFRHSG